MSWTSDHSLIRKSTVVQGVVINPAPFVVTLQWDTVPAKLDTAGHFVYKDIWDNLGSHSCVADPSYSAINKINSPGTLSIFPNPVVSDDFTVVSNLQFKSVQVFNIEGKEIQNKMLATPQNETNITLGRQTQGVYIVKVIFTDNRSTSQAILIK
jgi:hypothetical protein